MTAPDPALQGPVRILGGPGSGKTELIARLHRGLVASGTAPDRILVLVRSQRARDDLRRRLAPAGAAAHPVPRIWTIHDAARWIIGSLEADGPGPHVLTGFGTWLAARAALERARPDLRRIAPLHADPACIEDARAAVAACRQAMVGPGLLAERLGRAPVALQELAVIAARSEDVLRAAGAIDLDGAVSLALTRLLDEPGGSAGRFDALLADDAQEWDGAQFHLVCALARGLVPPARLAVAGDPRQAISGGTGGSARWFLEELPLAVAVADWALPGSRRCPPAVLAAAAAVDPGPDDTPPAGDGPPGGDGPRPAGPIAAAPPADVAVVEIWRADDEAAEALGVAGAIKDWVLGGQGRYQDVAVLLRSLTALGPVFADAFASSGVPCHLGRIGWSRHPALAALTAWMRWCAEPHDRERFGAVLESPWGGVSAPARAWLRRRSGAHGFDLLRAVRTESRAAADGDGDEEREEVERVEARMARALAWASPLRRGPVDPEALMVWVGQLAWAIGLFEAAADDPPLADVLRGVDQSLRAITDVEARLRGRPPTLGATLDLLDVALRRATEADLAPDPGRDAVHLLTVGQASGLGFARVFVCGCAAGTFPAPPRPLGLLAPDELSLLLERVPELQDAVQDHDRRLEEEARHLVVALTRASGRVTCTYPARIGGRGVEPSPLLRPLRAAGVLERAIPAAGDVTRTAVAAGLAALVAADPSARPAVGDVPGLDLDGLGATLAPFDPVAGTAAAVPEPLEISATAIGEWLACPRRLYYHRVLRPGPPDLARLRGQAAHRLLELVHRVEDGWRGDPDRFRLVAEEVLERTVLPRLAEAVPSRLAHRALAAWLRRLADRYAHHAVAAAAGGAGEHTLGVEVDFRLELSGVVVRGRIDRARTVDGGRVEILDYKTGLAVPSRAGILATIRGTEAEGPTDWQLPLYGLALLRGAAPALPAGEPALVRNWYVGRTPATGRDPDRPLDRRGLRVDPTAPLSTREAAELRDLPPDELAAFAGRLEEEGRRVARGRFPAQPRHRTRTCWDPRRGCPRADLCAGEGSVGRGHEVPRP